MIQFRTEAVRTDFHKLAPEVQIEIRKFAEGLATQKKSLLINFVDIWGFNLKDYEISFRIVERVD